MPEVKTIKVLLIEDEAMLAAMYETKFKKEGFAVAVANDGEAGLAIAKGDVFDIILVDIIMPKLDGFAVLKALRALAQYKTTPVVLLTNLGQEEDKKKGQALGATDYLVKANFTPSQVAAKVKELINK